MPPSTLPAGPSCAEAAVALTSTCQDLNDTACCSRATGNFTWLQYGLEVSRQHGRGAWMRWGIGGWLFPRGTLSA
jgi:hypothetical protein